MSTPVGFCCSQMRHRREDRGPSASPLPVPQGKQAQAPRGEAGRTLCSHPGHSEEARPLCREARGGEGPQSELPAQRRRGPAFRLGFGGTQAPVKSEELSGPAWGSHEPGEEARMAGKSQGPNSLGPAGGPHAAPSGSSSLEPPGTICCLSGPPGPLLPGPTTR